MAAWREQVAELRRGPGRRRERHVIKRLPLRHAEKDVPAQAFAAAWPRAVAAAAHAPPDVRPSRIAVCLTLPEPVRARTAGTTGSASSGSPTPATSSGSPSGSAPPAGQLPGRPTGSPTATRAR